MRRLSLAAALWMGALCVFAEAARGAGLTSVADPRAVQWSSACVEARLVTHSAPRPVSKDGTIQAQLDEFQIERVLDGNLSAGASFHTISLAQAGAGGAPLPVGTECLLLVMPLSGAAIDLPDGSELRVPRDAMVAIYQTASADLPADRRAELIRVIHDTRAADTATTAETVHDQVAALAEPHDAVEQEQAEKAVYDIGPRALPELKSRLAATPGLPPLAAARLRRAIDDLTPPPLRAEDAAKS